MARSHGDLKDLDAQLDAPDEFTTDATDTNATPAEVEQPAKSTAKASTARKSPRKKSATAPAAKKAPSRRRTTKAAAPAEPEPTPEPKKLEVRYSSIDEARRVGLNIHQEEYELLNAAKVKDRINYNLRIRAMITLYEGNARFRSQVDRLAKEAPKDRR